MMLGKSVSITEINLLTELTDSLYFAKKKTDSL